ncbi:hypothetical protein J3459_012246 [Metarhizium acridum]|nr:hypothetical protein J3459_012246 [Metarhizium acridum]
METRNKKGRKKKKRDAMLDQNGLLRIGAAAKPTGRDDENTATGIKTALWSRSSVSRFHSSSLLGSCSCVPCLVFPISSFSSFSSLSGGGAKHPPSATQRLTGSIFPQDTGHLV